MSKRHKMTSAGSRRSFSRGAALSHKANFRNVMRGGIRF